jgi:hypothetical protein
MLDGFDFPTYYKTIFPTRRKSKLQQKEIGALRLIILITLKRQDGIESQCQLLLLERSHALKNYSTDGPS